MNDRSGWKHQQARRIDHFDERPENAQYRDEQGDIALTEFTDQFRHEKEPDDGRHKQQKADEREIIGVAEDVRRIIQTGSRKQRIERVSGYTINCDNEPVFVREQGFQRDLQWNVLLRLIGGRDLCSFSRRAERQKAGRDNGDAAYCCNDRPALCAADGTRYRLSQDGDEQSAEHREDSCVNIEHGAFIRFLGHQTEQRFIRNRHSCIK